MTAIQVTDAEFETQVIQQSHTKPVLLKFWAPWCGPCKMLAPRVQEVADEGKYEIAYADLNVDEQPATATKFGIRGIPAMLIFHNGQVVTQKVGALSKGQLTSWIELALLDIQNRIQTTTV